MQTSYYTRIVLSILILVTTTSCTRLSPCYDRELYLSMKGKPCTEDCPGVTGCNGKKYCNECEANRDGIRIK